MGLTGGLPMMTPDGTRLGLGDQAIHRGLGAQERQPYKAGVRATRVCAQAATGARPIGYVRETTENGVRPRALNGPGWATRLDPIDLEAEYLGYRPAVSICQKPDDY